MPRHAESSDPGAPEKRYDDSSPFTEPRDDWHSSWSSEPASGNDDDVVPEEPPEEDDPYAGLGSVPGYDLGPDTESVVVDLTGSVPTVPGPTAALSAGSPASAPATPPASPAADPAAVPSPDVTPVRSAPAASAPARTRRSRGRRAVSGPEPARGSGGFDVPAATEPILTGAETLTAANVLRSNRARPQSGWRKTLLRLSGGKVNLGPSPADRYRAELLERARTPVRGSHRVAVISLKGGVGKTTTTAALGSMFAQLRGDRVIAVDANPDRGTLGERVPKESNATIRHLLEARHQITRYGDVRSFTSQSPTRLEVLASDSDPGASSALSEQDYVDTLDTLERFYNLVLTDCGTGLLHDAMRGVLGLASSLVVVSSASLDGARSASATLDWLEAHGFEAMAKEAVVVISSVRPGGGIVDVLQLEDHFAARCREVVTIPYDPHLEAGGVLDLDELDEETLLAYRELAAAVADGFSGS